jgi:hypothetical protein
MDPNPRQDKRLINIQISNFTDSAVAPVLSPPEPHQRQLPQSPRFVCNSW